MRQIEKEQFFVPEGNLIWEVDIYSGALEGIVIAENELSTTDFELCLPEWVGEEITGRDEYRKVNMLAARLASAGRWAAKLPNRVIGSVWAVRLPMH